MPIANITNYTTSGAPAVNTSGISSSISLIGFVIIGAVSIFLVLMLLANWESYKKMAGIWGWLARSLGYFGYGFLTMLLIGIPATIIYYAGSYVSANPQELIYIGEGIGAIVAGYFVLSGIGYLMKPIYQRIGKNTAKWNTMHKPKQEEKRLKVE